MSARHTARVRSRRSRSWAVLIAGLLVVGLAAWLLRQEHPGPTTPPPRHPTRVVRPAGRPLDHRRGHLDIERDGQVVRLRRLLSIDAPRATHRRPRTPVPGQAATTRLIELAPRGTELTILTAGQDRYGRTWVKPGSRTAACSGAEIVRSRLAAPVTIGGQDTFRAGWTWPRPRPPRTRGLRGELLTPRARRVPRRASTRHTARDAAGERVDRRRHRPGRPDQRAPLRGPLQPSPLP